MEISLAIAIYVLGVTSGALITIAFYFDRKQPRQSYEPTETGVGNFIPRTTPIAGEPPKPRKG
ncbi:hypothetical protein QIH87_50070 (plasmid) [Bradyrhizobium elkanii]|jgi:hypothetical protein|uniref:hypothetical protein n=1 Tax=Bradyrhizobium elkanii TaxID=29448 RepID=UPI00271515A5|nr:hypothetical protein [Bradyrhizobium elkanii]WLA80361.1 hypothetical protein QNJ99_33995 [Bradyrhizobium elkanii]WLB14779.1 hypothetical protein QIH87_50070 [Bradyrhizobium elkanii]WLB69129.1 hypothetical protein QIH89_27845 [Bradyrhizobium elkanii]